MSALLLSNDIMDIQISSNRVVFHATMAKAIQDSFASVCFYLSFYLCQGNIHSIGATANPTFQLHKSKSLPTVLSAQITAKCRLTRHWLEIIWDFSCQVMLGDQVTKQMQSKSLFVF